MCRCCQNADSLRMQALSALPSCWPPDTPAMSHLQLQRAESLANSNCDYGTGECTQTQSRRHCHDQSGPIETCETILGQTLSFVCGAHLKSMLSMPVSVPHAIVSHQRPTTHRRHTFQTSLACPLRPFANCTACCYCCCNKSSCRTPRHPLHPLEDAATPHTQE